MKFTLKDGQERDWQVNKIGVVGPGIVGMPMAAMLAHAQIKIGSDKPAQVTVVQRNSTNSGWKVDAINQGQSVIGGIEPALDEIVEKSVKAGLLNASHDYSHLSDADVVLIAIQTDKAGFEPDYGPLFGGLTDLAKALQNKPAEKVPLIVFESTLAPSSMTTVISDLFREHGLIEGQDILLGNSPNRVMPGRLVERVSQSDKLVAGLQPDTPKMIKHLYSHIVTEGTLFPTNSMTAEVVKTLENAYRDVRIAFSTEVVRFCDNNDIDFYTLRDEVNNRLGQSDMASKDSNCVPSGGLLIPTIGVGGHCLPKDGILLWWRRILAKHETQDSLIINSRTINDQSPANTIGLMEKRFGDISGKTIAVLGTAYRFNSEDTRNSPSIQLALQLKEMGCKVILHDPFVKPDDQNLLKFQVDDIFTNDINKALDQTDYVVFGTAHLFYRDNPEIFTSRAGKLKGVCDGCNLFGKDDFENYDIAYTGIGRGSKTPDAECIDFVHKTFTIMERRLAKEVSDTCDFLNTTYADSEFNKVEFSEVQRLGASCSTGCIIADLGEINSAGDYQGFAPILA